ncbi:MAG: (d)CMP kinase [Thermoflavifilum aggregans]|nr:(d)CMP kinase [Thermoflavifilum aggregans]
MRPLIIAIDGYSSCGKSTLARQLASALQYKYIDSGAMYRAITYELLRRKINLNDLAAIREVLKDIHLDFKYDPSSGRSVIWLNGENVEQAIRSWEVSEAVSQVAAIPEVREFAVAQQRRMGQQRGIVMDGRDIGTVVFPDADVKIFMTADVKIRAQRRWKELQPLHPEISLAEVEKNLLERDRLDTQRAVSPLRKAADAFVIDNSHLTETQQLQVAMDYVQKIMHNLPIEKTTIS